MRTYTLFILLLVYTLSFLDRQIVAILAEDIKRDLLLSDTQLGLLTGFAFALFYAVLGIPVARLAERFNRVPIISACVFIWSAMTALGAAASNFLQLALARAGVGVGEAGSVAPAHSMIADMYPPDKRSLPMAIFQMGAPLGVMISLAVGGILAAAIGWRQTLFYVGVFGILVAIIVQVTLKDPRQHRAPEPETASPQFSKDVKRLFGIATYRRLCLGIMTAASAVYALLAFLPAYLIRSYELPVQTVGANMGLATGIGGVIGLLAGGVIGNRLARRRLSTSLLVPALSVFPLAPLIYLGLFHADQSSVFLYAAAIFLFASLWQAPAFAAIQTVAPEGTRATAAAFMLLFNNLLGLGLGPLVIGMISDMLNASGYDNSLGLALLLSPFLALVSCVAFWMSRHSYRAEFEPETQAPGRTAKTAPTNPPYQLR